MFKHQLKPIAVYSSVVLLLLLTTLIGCRSASTDEHLGADAAESDEKVVDATAIEWFKMPPQDVQDLVNRSEAVVIGTVSKVSGTVKELPYFTNREDFKDWPVEDRPYIEVVYYDLIIEEVILDDGNIRDNPRIRLEADGFTLNLNGRYLFTLGENPDSLSYGIAANWMILSMDDDGVSNLDGTDPGYVGVADELSLLENARASAEGHQFLQRRDWPDRVHTGGDSAGDSGQPGPTPDSDGEGDGPVGNTGQGGS